MIFLVLTMLIGFSQVTEAASVEDLAWLAGCWASVGAEAGSGEQWMEPAGGTLLGVNRTVKGSETVAHEFMQIRETESGEIEFIANPSGQSEAAFSLVGLSADEVVFENPDHDFPQRIIYRLKGDDLEGRIEGKVKGELKGVDFPLKRVDCESRTSKPEDH
ncbi:MAG: DUF6265 family protein [Thermoanaerobaculia bacterium]